MAPKTVFITGCKAGGIGNSMAREFHSKGLHVFAAARDRSQLEDLAAIGIETVSLDVLSPQAITAARKQVEAYTGSAGLDYLVNNAGMNYTVPALDVDFDEVQRVFETNVFSVMRITKEFMPLLIQAKGTVVQIGSVAGIVPYVFGSSYNATKAALHSYSNTLRVEVAPFNVNVTVVVTGGVQSRIARTDRLLPADSLYHPINTEYQRRVKHSQEGAMSNAAYSKSVVSKVLVKNPPKWIYEGNKSWVVWWVDTFLPKGIWLYIMPRMFGLFRLAQIWKAKQRRD